MEGHLVGNVPKYDWSKGLRLPGIAGNFYNHHIYYHDREKNTKYVRTSAPQFAKTGRSSSSSHFYLNANQ